MNEIEVSCDNCKKAVKVKDIYINQLGFIEMKLDCGCKLFLKIERFKQTKK